MIDDQGITGALKEDKAMAGRRDEFAVLFAAAEAEDGSVLELLFRTDTFKEQPQIEEPRGDSAGAGGEGSGSGTPSQRSYRENLLSWV